MPCGARYILGKRRGLVGTSLLSAHGVFIAAAAAAGEADPVLGNAFFFLLGLGSGVDKLPTEQTGYLAL
jgi:hypothetical protein